MNWSAISAVADVLGAAGVIASLLYVAAQIRQSTRQSRLAALQTMVTELGSALQAQAQSRELAAIVLRGLRDLNSLDAVEKVQFLSHISHILRLYEAVYFHKVEGTLDERVWRGFEAAIGDVVSYPGMHAVLELRRPHLSAAFGGYLASLASRSTTKPIFGETPASLPNGTT
jgi:signal transduction histidine kinase